MDVQNVGFHEKCHISVNMRPTDLRQVSKFSLVTSLKLFLWHPKDLVSRKKHFKKAKVILKKSAFVRILPQTQHQKVSLKWKIAKKDRNRTQNGSEGHKK